MRLGLTTVLLIAIAATARPAIGQEPPSTRFHLTAEAGVSVQEGFDGVRVGRDMISYGLRLTADRGRFHPWIDGGRFERPDLECVSGLQCNDSGWLARAGISVPLSGGSDGSGVSADARTGMGAAFAEDASLSYLLGLALHWHAMPRVAPGVEFRWEHLTSINLTMLAAGIRITL